MTPKTVNNILVLIAGLIVAALAGCNSKTVNLSIEVYDADNVLTAQSDSKKNDGVSVAELTLEREYQKGDYLVVSSAEYMNVQFDENIPLCRIYAPKGSFKYPIPIGKEREIYSPESFTGKNHKISISTCTKGEFSEYKNLALNPFDIRGETDFYPHATSNSEFHGMSCFSARTAIDGYKTNKAHGGWPYQSWGPDKVANIWFKIDFGRSVEIDKLVILNRADYNHTHDSYWKQATLEFSDGTSQVVQIGRSEMPQEIMINKRTTSWVRFKDLKKHEDKWIAWTEVEVWGRDK
jgi:hypothetical protein